MPDIREWIAVLIALAALGWTVFESIRTRRAMKEQEQREEARARRAEHVELLNGFLLRLQSVLSRSKRDFEALMSGQADQIRRLEYYPATLKKYFESLPDDRRLFWERDLAQLHAHNDDAIRLIDGHVSNSLLTPAFQSACEAFRAHATRWKSRWDAITDAKFAANDLPSDQMADPFPENFDETVQQEITRVRAAANV